MIDSSFTVDSTIMDFQMKMAAKSVYTSGAEFSSFMGHFGQATNVTSLLLAIFGTQSIMRSLVVYRTVFNSLLGAVG